MDTNVYVLSGGKTDMNIVAGRGKTERNRT